LINGMQGIDVLIIIDQNNGSSDQCTGTDVLIITKIIDQVINA
jgi:hypothetical protein